MNNLLEMNDLFTYYSGSLIDFLREVQGNRSNRLMKIVLSPASSNMIDSSFNHVLDNFAVKHIFNKHANEKEVQRGQIMVEISDFLLIPDILANYDSCTILSHPTGRKLILYSKLYEDCIRFYVEEERKGRRELAGVTLYKKKKKLTGANS